MRIRKLINIVESLHNPLEIKFFKDNFNDPKIISRVQSQAARKNPKWKTTLVKAMKKYGFELIGSGVNGSVFENLKLKYIVKVYRTDEGFDEWINFCNNHQSNRFVPKLFGKIVHLNNIFSVVRMEHLFRCDVNAANQFTDHVQDIMDMPWNKIEELKTSEPELVEIAKFMRDWRLAYDLTAHNVMTRENGQFVIIDPLYIDPNSPIEWD